MNWPIFQNIRAVLKIPLWFFAFFALASSMGMPFVIGVVLILVLLLIFTVYIFRKIFLDQEVFERFLRLIAEVKRREQSK